MGKRIVIKGANFFANGINTDIQKEYQTINPSSKATTVFSNSTTFIGYSDIVANKNGYISSITSAFDSSYKVKVYVVDGTTNEVLSISNEITQTNKETDVRSQNIYVPKGARIGFGNGTDSVGGIMFTKVSGSRCFEGVGGIGTTVDINRFPTMELSVGFVIEFE